MKTIVTAKLKSNGNTQVYRFGTESEAYDFYLSKILVYRNELYNFNILTEEMYKKGAFQVTES
jgi:hypothetical protein